MSKRRVIDVHVHVGKFDLLRNDIQDLLMRNNTKRDFDVKELFCEPDILAEYLIKNSVEHAVLLGEDGPGTNYHITSEYVCEFRNRASNKYKSMFTCFGSLNPKKNSDVLAKYDEDMKMGIQGYKLYPSDHDFNACSDELMRLYEQMQKNGHVLMFHTGGSAQIDSSSSFQNPKEYEEIVKSFPNLIIIFCHGGKKNFVKEANCMMKIYDNVFIDTGFIVADDLIGFFPNLEEISHKVLFASDLPGGVRSLEEYIKGYESLAISEAAKENILYKNAITILNKIGE